MSTSRLARASALVGIFSLAAGVLVGACSTDPPSHSPWPTLEQGGSSPKTAVEGGKGKLPVAEKETGKPDPQTKDAGGSEN